MYLVPLALFFFGKGRGYYMAAAYPMLLAMGAAAGERQLDRWPKLGRWALEAVLFSGLALCGAYTFAVILPFQSAADCGILRSTNGDLREEFGWNELVKTVAGIRDSLPPDQQAHLGITTGDSGEYGAIDMLGPAYGLPAPIGTVNSEWLRGYPTPQPTTIIVLGLSGEQAAAIFTGCRLAGHSGDSEGMRTKRAETIRISSFAGRRGSPGQRMERVSEFWLMLLGQAV